MIDEFVPIDNITGFDCNKNTVIEASAGTGKTYTIAQMVPWLLARQDDKGEFNKYSLSNILIVTYTEKAAGELRSRIRSKLVEVKNKLESNWDNLTDELKKLKGKFEEEIEKIEDAQISTFHSFCQRVLTENAVFSNCSQNMTLIDESAGFDTFIGAYIRDRLAKNGFFLYLYMKDKNLFCDITTAAINKYYLDRKGNENKGIISLTEVVDKEIVKKIAAEEKKYQNAIKDIKAKKSDNATKQIEAEKQKYKDALLGIKEDAELWYLMRGAVIGKFDELYTELSQNVDNTQQSYEERIKPVCDAISELNDTQKILLDEETARYEAIVQNIKAEHLDKTLEADKIKVAEGISANISNMIQQALSIDFMLCWFVARNLKNIYMAWQQDKLNKGQQTYGDMIKTVHDAITEPGSRLLKQLKGKYKYAIIDEFQDTNQLEWNIFSRIFEKTTDGQKLDPEHHISIVGDPKQSIFSFQGTDREIYRVVKTELEKDGDVKYLDVNYRSTAPMINATNMLVQTGFCNKIKEQYNESKASDDATKQINSPQLNGVTIKPVYILDAPAEDAICSKIIEFCTKNGDKTALQIWDKDKNKQPYIRNVSFDDFAILVRNRNDANRLIDKMKKAGIPFMWHKDSTLFATKEAADWVALLAAIQTSDFNSENRNILRRVLQTEFFDVGIDEISSEKFDDILCHERQILLNWHMLAGNKQYAKLMNAIFEDSKISERLAQYDKIQSLAKYVQISNFVLDCLVSKKNTMATVIKTLKQCKTEKDFEEDVSVEKATDKPTVKITTIHSAKGLEFPIVFYFVQHNPNRLRYVRVVYSQNGTPMLNIEPKNEPKDVDIDSLRYVAITRASSLMFLINTTYRNNPVLYPWDINTLIEQSQKKYGESLFIHKEQPLAIKYSSASDILKHDAVCDDQDERKICENIELTHKKLYKHSYTSLSHHKTNLDEDFNDLVTEKSQRIDKNEDADAMDGSTKKYDAECGVKVLADYNAKKIKPVVANQERGKKYGTAVHEIFEKIDFEQAIKASYGSELNNIIHSCCARHSVPCSTDKGTQIAEIIKDTLLAKIPEIVGGVATGASFTLSSLTKESKKAEIEFNLNPDIEKILRNYYNGFIDLLFVRDVNGEKVYSILDWKTDLFEQENYVDYDKLKEHTDDKYSIQRVLYSYCLIQWLRQFYPDKTPEQIFNQHFGGVYYVFVRGCNAGTGNGIYPHTWQNYKKLSDAFESFKV
jgi:exodeoxyribonuclease V beta subunit